MLTADNVLIKPPAWMFEDKQGKQFYQIREKIMESLTGKRTRSHLDIADEHGLEPRRVLEKLKWLADRGHVEHVNSQPRSGKSRLAHYYRLPKG